MRLDAVGELVELASGVDSFYLSGRGRLSAVLVEDLGRARDAARADGCPTPFDVGSVVLHVVGRGLNRYPFRLEHAHGLIGLTASESLPTVTVQPKAAFIHGVGISKAIAWFVELIELLVGEVAWKASRIDLFVDSHGWDLRSDHRLNFVCRAKHRVTYEDDDVFRTLMFGTAKSGLKARIYDKSEESRKKGTDWWPAVWGERYRPESRVLRVEFEVHREVMRQSQIDTPADALERMPELWGYLTDRWLSFRVPTDDSTRSRWPVAPEWQQIQSASLRQGAIGLSRAREGERAGELRQLLPQLRGYLVSAGALLNAGTIDETLHRVNRHLVLDEQESGIPFASRLRERRLAVGA